MTTSHFADIHVLGEPAAVRQALSAVRKAVLASDWIDEEMGDVVGKASKPSASAPPWPLGQSHGCLGVVFEGNSASVPHKFYVMALETALAQPNVKLAAAVHWSFDYNAVRLWAASAAEPQRVYRGTAQGERLEAVLGMPLDEALAQDEVLDSVGTRALPALLALRQVQGCLDPLRAEERAQRLDTQIAPAPRKVVRARM